ncbi:hypothetical protein ACQBAT_04295 [Ornithinimicrobium sp. Y1847]|uniref:hypothetical protein n=1 Tax=Ornithinimicrobium sp. Y1847 TaxID=3405419 RepID=UPI003B678598
MSLVSLLTSVLPLVLLAAVSPMIFVNASTMALGSGSGAVLRYLAGNALVITAVGVIGAGLLGAAFTAFVRREIASHSVDLVIALVLILYGVHLARGLLRGQRRDDPQAARATGSERGRNAFSLGVVGMITNFTTLPLFLSAAQRIGGSGLPFLEVVLVLLLAVAVTLAPAWLPLVLLKVAPGLVRRRGDAPSKSRSIGPWLPVAACFAGGAVLAWRALAALL